MKRIFFISVAFLFSINPCFASNCANLYPESREIPVSNSGELCNSFYVVQFDTTLNAPIFSAELLNPNGRQVERSNDFHPDERLNRETRAENSDYDNTGYDKGHMTPAEDASSDKEMHDTFLLSNMTPQAPMLNRQPWRMLEEYVHKKVNQENQPTHIITGAIYKGYTKTVGKHHIPVPVAYYKIIYFNNGMEAYYAENSNSAKVQKIDLMTLQRYLPYKIPFRLR
jgi:endonuclease G, mitochondrial